MYVWLNDDSEKFLAKGYLAKGQSVDERVRRICGRAEEILGIPGFAERLRGHVQKGWISFSTPVWANFGTDKGLPISCFGSHIEDKMASILATHAEVGMMTKSGGGTSAYFGALRSRGSGIAHNGESSGSVHFMSLFENLVNVVSQGSTRRGVFAAYLPIDHDDVMEFLGIRSDGHPLQDIHFGVCVPDAWMESMIDGDPAKRRVWAKVLESRARTGYPYIFFTDNANKGAPDVYRDLGLKITHSNVCSEIMLPDGPDESFVCDLSSMNLLKYPEWKDTGVVKDLVYLLDAVMTEFINKAKGMPFLERAVKFAERHRALGVGMLGWHSLLQSLMIPFESMEAKLLNVEIARKIRDDAYEASGELARMFGEPELLKGYGRRNTTLMAVAPTKSSAFILGQASESIEPILDNYHVDDLAKGKYVYKNPALIKLLESKGKNDAKTWESILANFGSVQHLDFLTDHEKAVFKTFAEISQKEVVIQAAQRQKYIDQGQSLNLMVHPSTPTKDVNALIIEVWRLGVKSLYYQYGVNAAQQFTNNLLACESCEG